MNRVVLDASAVLALLNEEPGADAVADTIPGAIISTVNLSEIVAKLTDKGMPEDLIRMAIEDIGLEVRSFDGEAAYRTGSLRAQTKHLGLSLGDRACVALGQEISLPVLTTDRDWKHLDIGVEIRVIR